MSIIPSILDLPLINFYCILIILPVLSFISMINHQYLTRRSDLFSTVTGFTLPQFRELLDKFEKVYYQKQSDKIPEEQRKRKMGGGRKSLLGGIDGKLFFILFYYRNYPTLRFAQVLFEIEDSAIHRWTIFLSSVLKETLSYQIPLPDRQMRNFNDLYSIYPELAEYIVDGTDRSFERSKDNKTQELYYSGKKKRHTIKNQIFVNPRSKKIIYTTKTLPGSVHDKTALNDDGILDHAPPISCGLGDLGYEGIKKNYPWLKFVIPVKKKKNKDRTIEEKQTNKVISSVRVGIEHVIGKLKINRILSDKFRSNLQFADLAFRNCCYFYNFKLDLKTNRLTKR